MFSIRVNFSRLNEGTCKKKRNIYIYITEKGRKETISFIKILLLTDERNNSTFSFSQSTKCILNAYMYNFNYIISDTVYIFSQQIRLLKGTWP